MLLTLMGDQAPPILPTNLAAKSVEKYSAEFTVQQYVEVFNNLRKVSIL